MNIGIDIDDTISDTYNTMIPYAQKYTIEDLKRSGDINKKYETITHKYIQFMHGWNEKEDLGFWDKYYEEMVSAVKVKPFAREIMEKLHKDNKIIIITARWEKENKTIQPITLKWLKDNKIPYDKIIFDSHDKLKIAKENDIDLFIDDSIKNCKDVSEGGIKTFIMDAMLNRTYSDEKITRVYSWPHIYQEYENILKGEK